MCLLPEFIQPVKERPRTDCAVARRMVTRALGIQGRGRVQQYWGVPTSTTGERANNSDRLGFRFPQLTCWKYFYDTEALVACRAFHFIENIMLSHIHPCIQNKNRQQPTSILVTWSTLELPHLEKKMYKTTKRHFHIHVWLLQHFHNVIKFPDGNNLTQLRHR